MDTPGELTGVCQRCGTRLTLCVDKECRDDEHGDPPAGATPL